MIQYVCKDECNICPRQCKVDRNITTGFCKSTNDVRIARAALHMWEEPCISGEAGSGAIFFSGCNMRCIFCQNHEISGGEAGKIITIDELVMAMLELQDSGANNINLVTPSHYVNQIACAIKDAKEQGLTIPIVYNSSAYEKVSTLKSLEGLMDVYLPDCKYYSNELAMKYSKAPDYFEVAVGAIDEMFRQTGGCVFDERGIIQKGVIVRHLILPGHTNDSKLIISNLLDRYKDEIYISIMSQYTPVKELKYDNLNRRLTAREYNKVVDFAIEKGIVNGYIQDMGVALESFIPPFELK